MFSFQPFHRPLAIHAGHVHSAEAVIRDQARVVNFVKHLEFVQVVCGNVGFEGVHKLLPGISAHTGLALRFVLLLAFGVRTPADRVIMRHNRWLKSNAMASAIFTRLERVVVVFEIARVVAREAEETTVPHHAMKQVNFGLG